jgi:glutaredoxin-like protein
MSNPVQLVLFVQTFGCETCTTTTRILEDVARANPLVTVDEKNIVLDTDVVKRYGIIAAPGVAIIGDRDRGLRFYGAPEGHELVSLLDAVLLASAGDSGLSQESRALVATLTEPRDLKIFSTPSCAHCPRAIRLGWQLAVESDRITTSAVSAVEFPELVRRFRVSGVPKTVINESADILGAVPETEFVATVVRG